MKIIRLVVFIAAALLPAGLSVAVGQDADDVEREIRRIERVRLKALVAADTAVAGPLHAEDFQLVNPFGATLTKSEYLEGVGSGAIDYLVWEPDSEIEVRSGKEWAAIRYRSRIEIIVQGTHLPPTRLWHTDLYVLRAGRWEIVWSQATEIKQPSQRVDPTSVSAPRNTGGSSED